MKPNSLRLMLALVVVLLQLISMAVVSTMASKQLLSQTQLESSNSMKVQADEVVDKTRLFLVPALSQLTVASQLIADGMFDTTQDMRMATFFKSQLRSNHWLKGMYLGREDGSYVGVGRFSDGTPDDLTLNDDQLITKIVKGTGINRIISYQELNESTGAVRQWQGLSDRYDPRQRPWYAKAQAANQLVWSDSFNLYVSGLPAISASVPVRAPDGHSAGVLSVAIDLRDLTAFIDRHNNDSLNSAVLIDSNARVISYSAARMFNKTDWQSDIGTLLNSSNDAMRELFEHDQRVGMDPSGKDTMVDKLTLDGEEHMGLVRNVNLFDGAINWTLLITRPVSHPSNFSSRILDSGLQLAMLIIAAGALALVLVLAITAPVYHLHKRATIDQLTRAFNRDEFENQLGEWLANGQRLVTDKWLVAVTMDLDGFKLINDWHGHAAGDAILKAVVKRLQAQLHASDLVGRLGGDEFAVACMIDRHLDPVREIERIRRHITAQPVFSASGRHEFGLTMGLAVASRHDSVATLLKRADMALVSGKTNQKNRTYASADVASSDAPLNAATHTQREAAVV